MNSFNSRPHKEVDPAFLRLRSTGLSFNSRPHKEVDAFCCSCNRQTIQLSTHDLTRRSTSLLTPQSPFPFPFNSRPHKEVDVKNWGKITDWFLSTHDLTRRSTIPENIFYRLAIFQLTTSQGGRLTTVTNFFNILNFQLTTSQGGRQLRSA